MFKTRTYFYLIACFLLISKVHSQKSKEIEADTEITDKINERAINYYTIPTQSNKDVLITSTLTNQNSDTVLPVLIASNKPLPIGNKKNLWVCGVVGSKCEVPKTFFDKTEKIYVAIFCQNCEYTLKVSFNDSTSNTAEEIQNNLRNLLNIPQIRLLQEPSNTTDPIDPTQTDPTAPTDPSQPSKPSRRALSEDRKNKIRGTGVSSISLGLMFIFTVFIGCYIMMQIFVNTKLVTQPLKLGKIES